MGCPAETADGRIVMTEACREKIKSAVEGFRLPRYREIPAVGLYLEQTAKYISEYLSGLQ